MEKAHPDIECNPALVATLVAEQHPSYSEEVRLVSHGWDNDIYRIGSNHAVRMPRRQSAATLILNEQRWLSVIAPRLPVQIPVPVAVGVPSPHFPYPWSITPWFGGTTLSSVPINERARLVEPLATAMVALHTLAPEDAPSNPFRGVDLSARGSYWDDLIPQLELTDEEASAIHTALALGRAAGTWPFDSVWLHGDLHSANILVESGKITSLIDFGDICGGDPASDLAVAWFCFEAEERRQFIAHLTEAGNYDSDVWVRARAWAAGIAVAILASAEVDPRLAEVGRHTLVQLTNYRHP